jgi:restriction system protein
MKKGPDFLRFVIPLIETLKELGGSGKASEVTDAVLERMDISDEEQIAQLKSGRTKIRNRIAWARAYMAEADLIDASKRGVWALTQLGAPD